ncbi:MAG: glycosyltransferase [Gammaproteobacteria bacterium]|jgi:glycosyltransferase involved in cell wall biosynthesis|nr:glycosyltransferase [Gammaproteobacteria bacterium]
MVTRISNASCVLFENDAGITVSGKPIKAAYRQYRAGAFFFAVVSLWRLAFIQWEKVCLRPVVTISHLEGPNFANMLTVMGGRRVLFVHNRISKSYPGHGVRDKVMRYLCKRLYPQASGVVAVSPGIGRELVQSLGVESSRILVLPNPVDIKAIEHAATKHYGDYRDLLCRERYLVSVASLTRQKNHQLMLRVYERLISNSQDCTSVQLILLGDGPLRSELQDLCQQLGLHFFDAQENDGFDSEAKVYFLGFQQNPYPLISRAQLLLMTSRWEGLPIALLEAMSLGIPGVVSDCSEGIRDLWQLSDANMDDREEGRLGPATPFGVLMPLGNDNSKHVIQWAKEIEKLLRDPPQRNHYAKACRRRAGNYGIDHVAQLWNEHLLNPIEH